MNRSNAGFLMFFWLFWSAIVLVFDFVIIVPGVRQILAADYPSTEGSIISSKVTRQRGSKGGSTYGVDINYRYSVDGREYFSQRYRYDTMRSSDSAWAYAAVARFPTGARATVFYNPKNPANAVLSTGIQGNNLFMLMFSTPFNAMMIWFLGSAWAKLRFKWFNPIAGGVRLISEARKTRARTYTYSPFTVFLAAVAALAFVSIFIMGVARGFHPEIKPMIIAWCVILGGGFAVATWHGSKILSGKYDLVVDDLNSTLELPATQGRKERRRVPFAGVKRVYVETVFKSYNKTKRPIYVYVPTLCLGVPNTAADPAGDLRKEEIEKLAEWADERKAAGFVEWLNGKLPPKVSRSLDPQT